LKSPENQTQPNTAKLLEFGENTGQWAPEQMLLNVSFQCCGFELGNTCSPKWGQVGHFVRFQTRF